MLASSISPLRLDVLLPCRGSAPCLQMQFAPGYNQCDTVANSMADRVEGGKRTRLLDQACHLLRSTSGDKVDLLSYRKQKIAFILFFDCFFSFFLTHTHTFSLSLLLPYCPSLFSLSFFLCFHYFPLFRHFRNLFLLFLIPQCLFRTTILFTESPALFLLSLPSFLSVCSFRLSIFSAVFLRLFFARSFYVVSFNALLWEITSENVSLAASIFQRRFFVPVVSPRFSCSQRVNR